MGGQHTKFEFIDGKIFLVVEQLVWGEWLESHREDVTNKVFHSVDKYLNEQLNMNDYEYRNGKLVYTGDRKYL